MYKQRKNILNEEKITIQAIKELAKTGMTTGEAKELNNKFKRRWK